MGDHTTLPRFESAFDELVASAWDRLSARVSVSGWDTLAEALQDELRGLLARLARPTLVLELNVARLEDRLRGETPEERFRHYVDTVLPGDWPALLTEYQVLDAQLRETVELWIDALAEMAARLAADLPLRILEFTAAVEEVPNDERDDRARVEGRGVPRHARPRLCPRPPGGKRCGATEVARGRGPVHDRDLHQVSVLRVDLAG